MLLDFRCKAFSLSKSLPGTKPGLTQCAAGVGGLKHLNGPEWTWEAPYAITISPSSFTRS